MINFENLSPDMQSAIVSGLIGLLGAIIGALAYVKGPSQEKLCPPCACDCLWDCRCTTILC